MKRYRSLALVGGLAIALVAAGCASRPSLPPTSVADAYWQGRLSVRVESEPVQAFSADFTLEGSAQRGAMALSSPLGTTLAHLHWSPDVAALTTPEGAVQRYGSLQELTERVTGTELPIRALFGWLSGQPDPASGWVVDLGAYGQGRIAARRDYPPPGADLRVVLE